ncbi:MAG TPA: SDR family NAD(P)-dependent oxidoreductase, partial [Candidatus Deferrimicrobium sp.]|nr:SDR family NAD(P)-dependent oxidoreductase [Candidatus Deferrimicrobium sp.]
EMNRCFEILKPITGYDIKTIIYPSFADSRNNSNRSYECYGTDINQSEIAQPVIFIIEYALAKLLMSWGITPNAMIGHSTGEYTAACLAGVFSLENALKIVTLRDKPILKPFIDLLKQIPLNKPVIPYVSSITGTWVSGEQATDPTYWVNHLHQTIRFSDGVKELLKIENSIFIEVGPGRELTAFVEEYEPGKSGRQVIRLVRHPHEEIPDVYFLYREIGKLWLYGKEIDWPAFHRGGPGRRIPLPVYPFERQLFRIEKNTRAIPVPAGDLADCFYIPQWKRNIAVYRKKPGLEKNRWLIFMDRVGLGTHLVKYLEAKGDDVITVIAGETIQPQKTGDYLQLFQTLMANGKIADRIVHLWTLTGPVSSAAEKSFTPHFEETQTLGFYSLFHIAKAIRQISPGSNQRFRIYVISDHWQDVTGAEEIDPAKATMAGPLAVIPQEHPNIRCRSIDIIYPGPHAETLAGSLIEEMLNDKSEPLVAFRGPYRLTREFEPLHLGGVKREQLPLKEKGVYLITGGLGKIGSILAGFLARDYQARLILTSRSGNYDNEKIKEWENHGAEVMILKADAGDRVSIQNLIAAALERWGEINGVIHAAGIVKGASFNTVDNLQPGDCREQFQAKVYGTYIIDELLADKNLDFCILISSISVILGGLQFAVYAGANAFMDAFISNVKSRNPHWLSIDWDRMPERETIEAFKRVLALPLTRTGSVAVSSTGSLQARIDRWINLEITEENQETLTNARTDGFDSQKSYYPRPQLFTPYAAPMTKTQEDMVEIWKQLFGFDRVGIHDDFLELGGDSLKAITVLTAVHQKLNTAIPLPIFFSNPTIEKLAEYINSTKNVDKTSYLAIAPVEEKEYYSLSSAQKRLYFLQQLDLKSISYNMPFIYPLPKEINREKLESTLKHLIARHESLRTSFIEVKGEVVQRVHQNVDFAIEYYDLTGAETNVFGSPETFFQKGFGPPEAFIRPFDLSCAPLIRSGIMKFPGDQWFWLLDMHHIISDGTSHTILTEDFAELYDGVILEPLLLQYKDYAQWQNRMLENEKIKAQEDYWANLYTGEIPRLNMPADNKRPAVFTFAGDHFSFILDPGDAAKIKALGSAAGGTLYMSLLATLNILFFKYTGQSDIIIGCGIAGRPHADLQRIVGMFVNTLAMRNYPVGEKIYRLFLKEVIDQSIQAFANQDVQFEELVDRLAVERDPSR